MANSTSDSSAHNAELPPERWWEANDRIRGEHEARGMWDSSDSSSKPSDAPPDSERPASWMEANDRLRAEAEGRAQWDLSDVPRPITPMTGPRGGRRRQG